MLARVELVADKATRAPLPRTVTGRLFDECVRRGLLTTVYSPHLRLQPPLTTDEATLRNGLAVLREVFDWAERERVWAAG